MTQSIELREEERTRCEVWTRVMGYHRPISAFNPGKQSEQAERLCYREPQTSNGENKPK
ncbi:MAG: anaerobic ribonucleoside-triphosphate reductase [Candidatus Thiodiazotropha sp. LLP2]